MSGTIRRRPAAVSGFTNLRYRNPQAGLPCERTTGLLFPHPLMDDGGSIVLVSSGVHMKGIPIYHTYGATKAALRFWARSMAAELKDRSIRVNTLSPGAIETPIIDGQFKTKEEADAGKEMFNNDAAWTDRPAGGNGQGHPVPRFR